MKFHPLTLIVIALLGTALLSSCNKEIPGCMDEKAENFNTEATQDDGACTYAKEKFIGNYTVTQSCVYEDDTTYSFAVTDGPNADDIVLENFFNFGVSVVAQVSQNTITFNETKLGVVFEGSGYLVNNKLTIDFEVCEADYYPCSDPDYCIMNCQKK